MASDISARDVALSLLQTANSRLVQARAKNNVSDPTASLLEKLSPEKAEEIQKQQKETLSVVEQLHSAKEAMKKDVKEQRKNAAAMKIQQIKQRLQSLHLLATVDPKAAARLAAQLSRELADAVKEYANAGGSENASSLIGKTNSTDSGETQAANTDDAAALSDTAIAENAKLAEWSQTKQPVTASPSLPQDEFGQNQEQNYEAFHERLMGQIAKLEQNTAEKREGQEFINDVKKIKNALKSIIEEAKKQLEKSGSTATDQNIESADNALREVEKSLSQISGNTAGVSAGTVNFLV